MLDTVHTSTSQDVLVIRPYAAHAVSHGIGLLFFLAPVLVGFNSTSIHACACGLMALFSLLPRVKLDRRTGTVKIRSLWRFPLRRQLSEVQRVGISKKRRDRSLYRITLDGSSKSLIALQAADYTEARNHAESMARFLLVDIHDEALGRKVVHERSLAACAGEVVASRDHIDAEYGALETDEPLPNLEGHEILEVPREAGVAAYFRAILAFVSSAFTFWLPVPAHQKFLMQLMSASAAVTGIYSFFNRRGGTILVRDQPFLVEWKGLRWKRFMKVRSLTDFVRVSLSREERSVGRGVEPRPVYCVRLDGNTVPLNLQETHHADRATKLASRVADFLKLDLIDFTKSGATKGELRKKLLHAEAGWRLPDPPPETRMGCERANGAFVFKIPARGFRRWGIPLLLCILSPLIAFGSLSLVEAKFWQRQMAPGANTLSILFIVICILYVPLLLAVIIPAMRALRLREEVHVAPESIHVSSLAMDSKAMATLPFDQILDIELGKPITKELTKDMNGLYAPREVVRVVGTLQSVEFGGSLSRQEREWLRDAVATILLAEGTSASRFED